MNRIAIHTRVKRVTNGEKKKNRERPVTLPNPLFRKRKKNLGNLKTRNAPSGSGVFDNKHRVRGLTRQGTVSRRKHGNQKELKKRRKTVDTTQNSPPIEAKSRRPALLMN